MSPRIRQHSARAAACVGGLLVLGTMSMTPTTSSYFYDLETMQGSITAGEWLVIPSECARMMGQPHAFTVTGTGEDDGTLGDPFGSGHQQEVYPQMVLGLTGDDVLAGGNQHDCLVGGAGADTLFGDENGRDVLLGGDGNDHLISGNGKDELYGGPGTDDVCEGENGKDYFDATCERVIHVEANEQDSDGSLKPAPESDTSKDTAPETTERQNPVDDEFLSEGSAQEAAPQEPAGTKASGEQLTQQSTETDDEGQALAEEEVGDQGAVLGGQSQAESVEQDPIQQDSSEIAPGTTD